MQQEEVKKDNKNKEIMMKSHKTNHQFQHQRQRSRARKGRGRYKEGIIQR